MATAIWVKTESCDQYLWCVDEDLTAEEIVKLVEERLGEESEYVTELTRAYS